MTDTFCDHVQARARALHRFYSYCLMDALMYLPPFQTQLGFPEAFASFQKL